MSWQAVKYAIESPPRGPRGEKLCPAAWRVLIVLSERANSKKGHTCYPSIQDIAKRADIGERSVHEAIRDLRMAGRIEVEVHSGQAVRVGDQTYHTNLYRVLGVPSQVAKVAKSGATRGGKSVRPEVAKQRGSGVAKLATLTTRENHKNEPEPRAGFAEFYANYPRPAAEPAALSAYEQARQISTHAEIMAGLVAWKDYYVAADKSPEFVPFPAKWLNEHRWQDAPPKTGSSTTTGRAHAIGMPEPIGAGVLPPWSDLPDDDETLTQLAMDGDENAKIKLRIRHGAAADTSWTTVSASASAR